MTPELLSPWNLCAFCDHFTAWHPEMNAGLTSSDTTCKCGYATNCSCRKFCPEFKPMANDGFVCANCYQNFFAHATIHKLVGSRLKISDDIQFSTPGDTCYQVYDHNLLHCCHWTLWQFMKRVKHAHLKKGMSLPCVRCTTGGVLTLVEFDASGEISKWRWQIRSDFEMKLAVADGVSLPT